MNEILPYVGLLAEDTAEHLRLPRGGETASSRVRHRGRIAWVGHAGARVGDMERSGVEAVLLVEDGTHVRIPLTQLRFLGDDAKAAERALHAFGCPPIIRVEGQDLHAHEFADALRKLS